MTRMPDDRTPISPFLAAKLHVPALPQAVVLRPRLLDRLEKGLKNNHALTLISAPAGYGKTTLIAEWLAEWRAASSGPLVAWISSDPGDNDPTLFFAYLLLALERAGQAHEWATRALLQQPSQMAEQALAEGLLQDLATVAAAETRPLVMVLDDMHRISSPAIYAVLQQVIERLPPGCHTIMLTREDPPLSLARLRIQQRVTELRARDLRFTSSEAERFLNQIMALDLPAEAVEALALRTEGWIAGLQLAALSLENEVDRPAFIGSFAGDDRQVVDYLLEEVLMRQPADLRRFLLYSSILERMSGPLCDALLAEDGAAPDDSLLVDLDMRSSQEVLEELERRNLFLVSLDNRRTWYRYHHLFGELLYTHLQLSCDESTIRGLHLRAATWHGDHGFPTAAVSHALKADDHELAARLVEVALARPATWSSGNIGLLHDWWRALPAGVMRSRPLLSLRISRALYLSGRLDEAERLLDTTARALQDSRVPSGDADSLQAQITIYRAAIRAMRGEVERALAAVSGALPRLSEGDRLPRARAYDTLGLAHELRGDVDQALWAYLEASVLAEEAGVRYLAVNARCEAARVQILQGQLRQALATCESAIALGETQDPAMAPLGLAWCILGDIRREQNDLESAAQCLERGIELSRKGGITDDLRYEYLYLAQLQQCRGETEDALHSLQEADLLLHIYGVARLTELVAAQRTRVWLSQEQVELAERWADAYMRKAPAEYVREYEELTLARVFLAQGELDAAADRLHAVLAAAEAGGRMGVVLECLVLLARTAAGRADDDRSVWLARALTLAEPEGYARVFLDEGLPMAELLASVPAKSPGARYARRLVALFAEQPVGGGAATRDPAAAAGPHPLDADRALLASADGALVEPLTDREQEVLVLLSQRLTNAEIAQRLVISLPTVKSHTSHIYAKLDVGDRRAAVERARALGLLPQ